ncbi:MAG: molybdopterin-dependent oxidoreductase [Planctomycetaceae bacterium]
MNRRDFLAASAALSTASPLLLAGANAQPLQNQRASDLIVHTTSPMNAEPQLANLVKGFMTPTDQFYIRSHAPNPKIDPVSFRLKVEGLVERELSISLSELANDYTNVGVTATLTCAGNRRYEHSKVSPIKGVPWREGAIGNAQWGGVPLAAILKKAGVKQEAKHVWFEGLDEIEKGGGIIPFGGSIPILKAMDSSEKMPGALVVTEMNNQPLTPDHGYPVRTVVPGYIGARSVKWLGKIVVSDRPSPNHYVATAYKVVERADAIEWAEKAPIYRYILNSAICTPAIGEQVKAGELTVRGYSLPFGDAGRTVAKIEVSADAGKSWVQAKLGTTGAYCWRLWEASVPIAATTKGLVVRATDSAGKTQPQFVDWNKKGYLFNAWHKVPVKV